MTETDNKVRRDAANREFASVGREFADWITDDGWYRPDALQFLSLRRSTEREANPDEICKHVLDRWVAERPVVPDTTFRPVSCISANSVSKAILSVAIHAPLSEDRVHPRPEIVSAIMRAFMENYCIES